MKKVLYTLNIGDYAPEICAMTYPLLKAYAHKIGADFHVIRDRKFPDYPVTHEKLQIYELGKGNDWNIFIDSDALVHPDFFDVTEQLHKDTVCHNGVDMAGNRWRYDNYFRRDGRHIGSCTWFVVCSDWTIDLWKPIEDLTLPQILDNIHPIVHELKTVITKQHLIDDYTLSRNIAKYGLKLKTVFQMMKALNDVGNYLWHQYTITEEQKIIQLAQTLASWELPELVPDATRTKVDAFLEAQKQQQVQKG